MTATQQYRAALAAQNARKGQYKTRVIQMSQRDYEWRLYTADLRAIVAAGWCTSAASARRDMAEALRIRIEYPEHFTNEKAAA